MICYLVKDKNFEQVLKDKIVLVDFWAEWCKPCELLSPILDEFGKKHKVTIHKINVEDNEKLAKKYGIFSLPTIKCFKEGKITGEIVGFYPKEKMFKKLQKLL